MIVVVMLKKEEVLTLAICLLMPRERHRSWQLILPHNHPTNSSATRKKYRHDLSKSADHTKTVPVPTRLFLPLLRLEQCSFQVFVMAFVA